MPRRGTASSPNSSGSSRRPASIRSNNTAAPAGWTLVLRPRELTLAAIFERMEITGRRDVIDRIAITEAGGDRRTMTLSSESIRRRAVKP